MRSRWPRFLPPLATVGGVAISGGAYGSGLTPGPGARDEFYGLTDRGPNVDGPNGTKVEGVATTDGGRTLVISDDSEFGISGLVTTTPPFQLKAKILPNGTQDDGEYLVVDTRRLPAATSTATARILVIA